MHIFLFGWGVKSIEDVVVSDQGEATAQKGESLAFFIMNKVNV